MPAPPLPLSYKPGPARRAVSEKPSPRIFICDDDLDFAMELANGLSMSGFETKTLSAGCSMIEIFETFQPDMMLLDIFMPPPDGFEVINHICNSAYKNIPIVLISGAGIGLLEVATRYCIGRKLRLAATFRKPLRIAEIARVCDVHVRR